ncbi:MAG: thioredoxin-like domain-containing protein [Candidatus Sulfotelmatobacter sp.]
MADALRILVGLWVVAGSMGLDRFSFLDRTTLVVAVLLACTAFGRGQQAALDLDGHAVNPLLADSNKVVVLVFLRRDCPVSSRYAPVIQQISQQYADRATFWLVYPDKSESPQAIRKYLQDYGYHLPAVRDPEHALVKMGRAQITPEVAVFDRSRRLVYDGRIDDWYLDLSRARPAPTTHELEDALRAVLAGKAVAKSEVRGVGCYISDLE